MSLGIAYQGADFAALATDSLIPQELASSPGISFEHGRKFTWACYRRVAYMISGIVPGHLQLPTALPADSLQATQALAKWAAGRNPEKAHVMAIGAPFGDIPTAHRVVIGSDPSQTTLAVGDVAFVGGFDFLAREMGAEKNYGPLSIDVVPTLLAAIAHAVITRGHEWARRKNDGSVAAVDWPVRVAVIGRKLSTEHVFPGVSTGVETWQSNQPSSLQ